MKRLFAILVTSGIAAACAQAQMPACGTDRLLQSIDAEAQAVQVDAILQKAIHESAGKQSGSIVIPTVFHIVYNSPQQDIPDSVIHRQMQIMNDDFQRRNADTANTPTAFQGMAGQMDITFCLAQQTPSGASTTGILHVPTNVAAFNSPTTYAVPDPVKHSNSGGSDAWDTEHYLNIWICNLNGSTAYSAPPGNFMPDDEGVVCKYQHVGLSNVYPYGRGRSIVHELGHYFCLKHIWGDDQGGCTGTDFIGDTPNQSNYSTNCPNFPLTDACSPNAPGVMFMNYMDYSEDGCRNMFSAGQASYMHACLTSLRPGFLTAQGCIPVVATQEPAAPGMVLQQMESTLELHSKASPLATVRICNLGGQVLHSFQPQHQHLVRIPKSSLGNGLLIIEATTENGVVQRWKVPVW
ncbi:MAG TPA: zinc metalloprotease [Bacteroidia bacterium]|nr:zinc metalloprotease [Bacteroidia bacterium]